MSKKPNFTPASGKCIYIKIEAVYDLAESEELEDTLEELRKYGSAVVTEKTMIAEDFQKACEILDKRKLKEVS